LADWAQQHRESEPRPLPDDFPADLAGFIRAALIKDPPARLRALQPFLRDWARITESLLVSQPPVPRDGTTPDRRVSAAAAAAMTVIDPPS